MLLLRLVLMTIIGRFSNHDDNSSDNDTKKIGLMSENNASASVFAFYILLHFFAVPCKKKTPNNLNIGFARRTRTHDGQFSFSLFELESLSMN